MHEGIPVALALGTGHWTLNPSDIITQRELTSIARNREIKILDTSRIYGLSESFIGREGLASEFRINTKAAMAMVPGGASKEGVLESWSQSQKALKTEKVSFYVLHVPDESVPISETMEGVQELYKQGKFEYFGLSNFSYEQAIECYNYAKSKSYVLPSIYEIAYNLVARRPEASFYKLRELGFSIHAYSPLASGFFMRTPEQVQQGKGHWDYSKVFGKIVRDMYGKPSYLQYLDKYSTLADESGAGRLGVALRWQ